ncbi:MAG: hypothetical protein Q8868_13305 [Bacteroidota bacterium]|nr:hypothetical protein [Bacteroidota bacterium]
MLKKIILILFLSLPFYIAFSQDTSNVAPQKKKAITLTGYVSSLQTAIFDSLSGPFENENLIHNRLNFKGYFNENITVALELRNRMYTGDLIQLGEIYTNLIKEDPGFVKMSWNIIDEQSILLNTKVDRLWLDFHFNKVQFTLGRQRINWGQTLVWNPNDIFNAYSFFDVDYIERPGCDAVRFQFFPSSSSVADLAVKVDKDKNVTAAGLFRFNAGGYDIQFLTGLSNSTDIVVGTGWSGHLGSVSFRGEATWFDPYEEFPKTIGTVMVTGGFDKIFKDNSVAQIQAMYCNKPASLTNLFSFYSGNLPVKELALSKFTGFGQFTWAVNPLLNLTASGIWFPDLEGYYAGISCDYSLAENVDFSLIWQHFNAKLISVLNQINLGFLRIKYSF